MKSKFRYLSIVLLTLMLGIYSSCKKDDNPVDPNAGKAKIESLQVTPDSNLKYGDAVTLSGNFSDDKGLRSYTITMSNSSGVVYETTNMLTGKTFALNQNIPIALPKNAVAGDMTISVTVKNSEDAISTQDLIIKNVNLPVFDQLYLFINGTAHPMKKNGNVFEVEDFFPANAVGKIYSKSDKTGMAWGLEGAAIQAMGANDITVGKATEEYYKITFNPVSFDLTIGDTQVWNPMDESLYILGTISGHWADGEISTEKAKMKMAGSSIGTRKMWTWTAPNTGTGSADDDMWGNIVAGVFRFKLPGVEQYVTFSGGKIVVGADDKAASFVVTDGGTYTIKVMADGNTFTKVRLDDGTKTLEYTNEGIYLNGALVVPTMTFANKTLNMVAGNYFVYDGTMDLTKGQSITAQGVNLATAFCDPDVFTGKGNSTWTVIQESGTYFVRIDAFSGNIYVRKESGFPDVIYLDGWCWGKYEDDAHNWNPPTRMTLYRKGTTNVYEATMYILPWGGDISLYAAVPEATDAGKMQFYAKYFTGVENLDNNIKLPVPAASAFYKVTVDFKDGFTWDKENLDGTNFTLVPTNGKKFTIVFTPL
ncbi:MAG TPA: hypothetical protein VK205_03310 [Prolixibacteraceae bacterium]|nr:hypothetical protein [Prolixibacteraceae bacterium]